MTRDKFNELTRELGIKLFFREEFLPYPSLRVFCSEDQKLAAVEFFWMYVPAYAAFEIITELHNYRAYQLPRSTFKQHLQDCSGWAKCWR